MQEFRKAVRRAVKAGSLRGVAAEVGMSAPGLKHFVDGGTPMRYTIRKLAAWYAAQPGADAGVLDRLQAEALALLLSRLPEERQESAEREIRAILSG